jgi:hypothetical protein
MYRANNLNLISCNFIYKIICKYFFIKYVLNYRDEGVFMSGQDPIFIGYFQNMKLPEGGDLIGQTTGRGKDGKGRLIIYIGGVNLAQGAAQTKTGSTFDRDQDTTYAIMGPAAKAIKDSAKGQVITANHSFTSMTQEQAEKKSSEWTWLPRCLDIFKTTFLVNVGGQWYDMNASSLKKALGITKQDIRNNNRDITSLIIKKATPTLSEAKISNEILGPLDARSEEKLTAKAIKNPETRVAIREAYQKGGEQGISKYLDSLLVDENPRLTIGELRELNPKDGAQKVINQALVLHLRYNTPLSECLLEANSDFKIEAIKDPVKAQETSNRAIEAANREIQEVNPEFAITTTSPDEDKKIEFKSVRSLRDAPEVKKLDPSVFTIRRNFDVRKLIKESKDQFSKDSTDSTHTTIQAASQYNSGEAPASFTPLIGRACVIGRQDNTQGPIVQTKAPEMFEITNRGANNGINSLASVIKEKTHNLVSYPQTTLLENGYLTVGSRKDLTEAVIKDFCENGHKLQSVVQNNADYDVVLSAAPSWQGLKAYSSSNHAKDLAFVAAFYNYSALFEHGLKKLNEQPSIQIRICPTAIGCGAFNNDAPSVFKAFNKAACDFYQKLSPEQRERVKVEMQIFDPRGQLAGIENLGIQES